MTTNKQPDSDHRKPASDGSLLTDEIINFAMLLGYDLRATTGLTALRDDVEFVKRWHIRSRTLSKFLLWAGGALISGLLAGLSGALLAGGHAWPWSH